MVRPVAHITSRPPSHASMVKHLHISKARQKELLAMMDEARAALAAEKQASAGNPVKQEENLQNAPAAD